MIRFFIAAIALFFSVSAAAEIQANLNSQQTALLNEAQDYLAKIKTFKANFVQINPGTSMVSSGKLLISKPGQLKMAYKEPYRIDYYINDDNLIQYDYDLVEVTRGEAPQNPLKVLLYNDITLSQNDVMNVTNVTDGGKVFDVFLLNKTDDLREISGLILKFRKFPIDLISIGRVDNEGNNTQTNFSAITINEDIEESEIEFRKQRKAFPNSRK
jgi:outer membrane lipoprotein-sorting protein